MHFSNPSVGKEAKFKMLYNSISSPPSRYFFAKAVAQCCFILSRLVAGCERLS